MWNVSELQAAEWGLDGHEIGRLGGQVKSSGGNGVGPPLWDIGELEGTDWGLDGHEIGWLGGRVVSS